MPQGTRRLLGLGLKFSTSRARPTNRINRTIDRDKQDIRKMAFFKENPPKRREGIHYIPQLYIKNNEWIQRLTANKEIKQELENFESKLRQAWRNYQKRLSISNLTIRQWQLAEQLLKNDNHIVVEADKKWRMHHGQGNIHNQRYIRAPRQPRRVQ